MAKAAVKAVPAAAAPQAGAPAKGGSRKKVILIALIGLALGGGGAGAWFYLHKGADQPGHEPVRAAAPPVFINLEPFTVNLQPDGAADQYLQAVAVLRVADDATAGTLKQYMPELRHRVLLLLSSKKAAELSTPAGREQLAEQLRAEANRILSGASGAPAQHAQPGNAAPGDTPRPAPVEGPVRGVLFTSFIIQ